MTELKTVDYMRTKRKVVNKVAKYERAIMRVETGQRPKITQTYDITISGSGGFNSKTEKAGVYAAEGAGEDLTYIKEFVGVVNRLKDELKEVFVRTYIQRQKHFRIVLDMNVSSTKLSLMKREATELFAYGMDCEVYEGATQEKNVKNT